MKNETINHTSNTLNPSFQQKSAGLSLLIISSAALYFIARAWPMRPAAPTGGALPDGYGGLVLTTLALIIVAQIVLQTVLAIGQGSVALATAAQQMATLKARRNAYFVLVAGTLTVVVSGFVTVLTPFDTVSLAILGLALSEIVQQTSQLVYGRR